MKKRRCVKEILDVPNIFHKEGLSVKKILSVIVLFMLLSAGAAFADNVKVRPLSAMTLVSGTWDGTSGSPSAWCNVGGTIDGLVLFDAKGTGTVKIKAKILDTSGALVAAYDLGSWDPGAGTAWQAWSLSVTDFPCVAPGVYSAVIQFKTPWNGVVKSVSTKLNIF